MTALADSFSRLRPLIEADLRAMLSAPAGWPAAYYPMLHYHMGWVDEQGQPVDKDGGKRIRPVLCLLVSEAVCGDPEPARAAAVAVELIHNFSLLHDDVQDHSPLRRGRATVWSQWGAPKAINAGDAMFALAYLAVPRLLPADTDPGVAARMITLLGETCLELTRGQHLDMSFEERDGVTTDDYLDMITGKTGALLRASAQLGALAAGADDETRLHYRAFGENLGMAFQVRDDMLDIWGDPERTGKEEAVDIRQRKKSLPVLYGLARSDELRQLYAQDDSFSDEQVQQIITLLDETGARTYAAGLARRYSDETIAHLDAVATDNPAGEALYELVAILLDRDH